MYVLGSAHGSVCTGALDLELEVFVSWPDWMQGLWFCTKVVRALEH